MKKILIVGVSSVIGSHLAIYLRKHYRVYGTYGRNRPRIDGVPSFQLYLDDHAPILETVRALKPHAVVYCPGMTDESACERDPAAAFALHATYATRFASAVARSGGRLVYLSTAKVFSGKKGNYLESDPTDPAGAYGSSKRRAEELLCRQPEAFVLRIPTFVGLGGLNQVSMLNRLLRSLHAKERAPVISDEYRTFVFSEDVCQTVGVMLDTDMENAGIYHLGSREIHSYYTFATYLARALGRPAEHFEPVPAAMFRAQGKMLHHPNLTLANDLLRQRFFLEITPLERSLERLARALRDGRN